MIFSLSAGGGPVFSVVLKATKKAKKVADIKLSLGGAAAPASENSTDIRNVSCFCFHKALGGLGLPFPAARIIALHFQSDNSISLQTDPSLQGSPLGIKQLWRHSKVCDVTNKTTP